MRNVWRILTVLPLGMAQVAFGQASAKDLFGKAVRDFANRHFDIALSEFEDFLVRFPDDPNAPGAQENLAKARMAEGKFEDAANDFGSRLCPPVWTWPGLPLRLGVFSPGWLVHDNLVLAEAQD